jgi:large subunit ribosomal protein L30
MASERSVKITQRRSANGANPAQRETLRSLGLRGIGRSVERADSPELRGMIRVVSHLVESAEVEASSARKKPSDG